MFIDNKLFHLFIVPKHFAVNIRKRMHIFCKYFVVRTRYKQSDNKIDESEQKKGKRKREIKKKKKQERK